MLLSCLSDKELWIFLAVKGEGHGHDRFAVGCETPTARARDFGNEAAHVKPFQEARDVSTLATLVTLGFRGREQMVTDI